MALITGGASGIGLATAERLLASGWKVAIVDRDEKALEAQRKQHGSAANVFLAPLDVTDESAAQAVVGQVCDKLGGLDGVVNSAGIAADIPALDTPVDLFRKILDVNVTGSFIVARAAAQVMKERGGGAIVNMASVSGLRGSKGRSAYGASKGAVVVLTQVLANDLARYGIRVNAVAPGPVEYADGQGHARRQGSRAVVAAPADAALRRARRDRERDRVSAGWHQVQLHDRRDRRRGRRLPRRRHHRGRLGAHVRPRPELRRRTG